MNHNEVHHKNLPQLGRKTVIAALESVVHESNLRIGSHSLLHVIIEKYVHLLQQRRIIILRIIRINLVVAISRHRSHVDGSTSNPRLHHAHIGIVEMLRRLHLLLQFVVERG